MIDFYYWPTPNGWKIAIALEEMNLPYTTRLVNIGKGEQFNPNFLKISTNNRMPAIVDHDGPDGAPLALFESGAILQYLARKTGTFYGTTYRDQLAVDQWLMWQMGSAPFLGGGFGHFYTYAPEKIEYAINRYAMEVKRQLDVLDRHLAQNEWMAGDYSIADMAIWPWYGNLVLGRSYPEADKFLDVGIYTNLKRWADAIEARPAAKRGRIVNKVSGDPSEQMAERHSSADFAGRV